MDNAEKWPNINLKSGGVLIARFLQYVWPIFYIMINELIPG